MIIETAKSVKSHQQDNNFPVVVTAITNERNTQMLEFKEWIVLKIPFEIA